MNGFLFEQIVFGPIRSRRLGISLGLNLLPLNKKHCTFNCLYCECGWTLPQTDKAVFPGREEVREELGKKLASMQAKNAMLDAITFAGNGEPTIHPEFAEIIDDTIILRDQYYPKANISVLSNATKAGKPKVASALKKIEQNILKLDAGTEETFQKINNPKINISLEDILQNLRQFKGQMIIQTLFVKGHYRGVSFDNTTEEELTAWLRHLYELQPKLVMIYPIARATPAEDVEKIGPDKLWEIAQRVESLGIATEVYT
ncbi:MAG: radical SAM protein [Bacteroides sp.]|jgi:wyosine [tRNA(Phe)-imidazoG37] synthetase (radical SAM superfamily)|nr:radical SAM protein [Bacteroides sp.]